MKQFWTEEQEAALRRYWVKPCNLKSYLHLFGDRSYKAVISKAKKRLKLGARPHSARGVPAYSLDCIKEELTRGGPGTCPDICKRTGLTNSSVCKRIASANPGPTGKVHISAWIRKRTGGEPTAVYAIGPGENAEKPIPLTSAEKRALDSARRRAKSNPFLIAINQVTGDQASNQHIQRGRYTSRVIQREAA